MRAILVALAGVAVGAAATAAATASAATPIRVQITNVGSLPLTLRWPNYDLATPPPESMADRFTIQPGVFAWLNYEWKVSQIDIEARAENVADPRVVTEKELEGVRARVPDWAKFVVPQRKLATGCIPTGFEYLLRSAGVEGVDYAKFQEEFDLGAAVNDYATVAAAVCRKYPQVRFAGSAFKKSEEATRFVEESIDQGRPIVIAIRYNAGSCHIVPVLGYDERRIYFLQIVHADGTKDVRAIARWELARRDQEFGQTQCAWLETKAR
jgi:hypothetical protein